MRASAEKLVRDVRVVVQDAENLIKATAGDIGERTREARAKLAGALVVAKETLNKAEAPARDAVPRLRQWLGNGNSSSFAFAFLAGVLCGVCMARRHYRAGYSSS